MSKKTDLVHAIRALAKTSIISLRIGNEMLDVQVYHTISDDDRISFVSKVCDGIIRDGKRSFALYDSQFNKYLLQYLTDLRFSLTEKDLAALTQCTDIISQLRKEDQEIIDSLDTACRKQIDAAQSAEVAVAAALVRPDPMDRIADAVETLFDTYGGAFQGINPDTLTDLTNLLKGQDVVDIVSEKLFGDTKDGGDDGSQDTVEPSDKP